MTHLASNKPYHILQRDLLERYFEFQAVPTTKVNTLAGGTIAVASPSLVLGSAGAVVETNKLLEVYLERDQFALAGAGAAAGFRGPGATSWGDYTTIFSAQVCPDTTSRANAAADAYAGIEIYSRDVNNLNSAAASASLKLVGYFNDFTKFALIVNLADGGGDHITNMTVPKLNADPNVAEGHLFELIYDPFALTVTAWVDRQATATASIANINVALAGGNLMTGAFLWTGNNAVANGHFCNFSYVRHAKLRTWLNGSGLV